MLAVGAKAPDFSLPDHTGTIRSLVEYRGSYVLLYFYPKDDTPGCTTEACMIRDIYHDFTRLGVVVLGVSKDSVASHKKFALKYELPFTLLSDESTTTIQAYGAWKEKSMYGKKYMGTDRVSYLIDPTGKIVKVYPKVDPGSHALELVTDVQNYISE